MTDDNSNSFAERLKRIEEKNPNAGKSQPEPSAWAPSPVRRKSGLSSTAVGIFLCGGVIIGAGTYAYKQLPEGMIEFATGGVSAIPAIAAFQQDAFERFEFYSHLHADDATGEKFKVDSAEKLDPTLYDRVRGRIGYIYGASYAASADAVPVPVTDVFADYAPMGTDTLARSVASIAVNGDCTLRAVAEGEKLVNVNVRHSRDLAPLQFADEGDVVASLQDVVRDALEDGVPFEAYPNNPNGTGVINVMVTDTSGPLYLALQTLGENTMWRIHAAPEVEIAHVALIGPGSAGFAGNVGNASYEVVRASDFYDLRNNRNPYDFVDDPTELECMARPFREPNETWGAWAGSAEGNTLDGNLLFGQDQGFNAYEHWFATATGAYPQTNMVDAYIASHVLVGPKPEAPLAAPAVPERWHFVDHDYHFTGAPEARTAQFHALTEELAVAAAGGDPFAIIPPETVITTLEPGVTLATVEGELPTVFGQALERDPVPDRISLDDYNGYRVVKFSERLKLQDLLTEREEMPPEELMTLYALMRAPKEFSNHCAPALESIASRCGMIGMEVRVGVEGTVGTLATFGYIPTYEMGHYARSTRKDFSGFVFGEKAEDEKYLDANTQAEFVERLQTVCNAVREKLGNCIISEAAFAVNGESSSRALGRVAVYQQDYNKFEESRTQEIVDAAFAASAAP